MEIGEIMRRLVFSFCDTRDLFQSAALVCHAWRRETVVDMRCWINVRIHTEEFADKVITKWRERLHGTRIRGGPRHMIITVRALHRWLDYENGLLLSSLLTLEIQHLPYEGKEHYIEQRKNVHNYLRRDTIDRLCRAAPYLQRLTCIRENWDDGVPALTRRLLCFHPSFTSLRYMCEEPSMEDVHRWTTLRDLQLSYCSWPISDSLSSSAASFLWFPLLETLDLSHAVAVPVHVLECIPRLHTLSLNSLGLNGDNPWRPPPTLTRLRYHTNRENTLRVDLRGVASLLRELCIDCDLVAVPTSGVLSLPVLTELTLTVSKPFLFTLEAPTLLSLQLYGKQRCTFDFRRLIVGNTLHSCRLRLENRQSTLSALTQLARVPRPTCVIYLGRHFGDFGFIPSHKSRRKKKKSRPCGGRSHEVTDKEVVWVQMHRTRTWYEVKCHNYVTRRENLSVPLCFHSRNVYPDSTYRREYKSHGTPLSSIIVQLARQGTILLDEDFVVQRLCPTNDPACICRQLLLP